MKALIVVPTYDEAENITTLLDRVMEAEPRADVLVVDDGSPDGTADLVQAWAEDEPRVHLLRRTGKGGLGSAYRAGFAWGRDAGYDVLVEMDADLSHPADRLPAMLDGTRGADVVIGSRYVKGGATVNWPASRQLISRAGNTYVRLALGLGVSDATAGFRAYRLSALEKMGVWDLTSDGYCFQVEGTHRAVRAGLKVREVPITFTEREHGTSKMSRAIVVEALWKTTLWGLRDLVRRSTPQRRGASVPRRLTAGAVLALVTGMLVWGVASASTSPSTTSDGSTSTGSAPSNPGSAEADTAPVPVEAEAGAPQRISIPSIGVDSDLLDLGLDAKGELEVPTPAQAGSAGWYSGGPAPGDPGPSVVVGHVDSVNGPAVFADLGDLEAGQEIDVTRAGGVVERFAVRSVTEVEKKEFPTDQVYGPTPGPELRIITCGGEYDQEQGWKGNVLVFATPV
ncbi:class F sortase [Solicola sp. PLA-1-18]|uniref:class F sortase n=1 Tax=Solicola sp. PLA-1-18 TaxID=3380532 RepID=UPI003B7E21D5